VTDVSCADRCLTANASHQQHRCSGIDFVKSLNQLQHVSNDLMIDSRKYRAKVLVKSIILTPAKTVSAMRRTTTNEYRYNVKPRTKLISAISHYLIVVWELRSTVYSCPWFSPFTTDIISQTVGAPVRAYPTTRRPWYHNPLPDSWIRTPIAPCRN